MKYADGEETDAPGHPLVYLDAPAAGCEAVLECVRE